jgi:bifunctional UDP-N-acetylglucosamine pyrophosphorylase / glucosamine-1-phosphate N-acetyltransferase
MSAAPSLVVVLAAGEGSRMKSSTPKVLHPVLGVPLLGHVLREVQGLSAEQVAVVVGHQREKVAGYLNGQYPACLVAVQSEQLGTGHAVRCALDAVTETGLELGAGPVVVTAGDTPLLTTETLQGLLDAHQASGASATVLSARVEDATGYGRIVRDDDGAVLGIVEHKDASDRELAIDEINSGVYAFAADALADALAQVTADNAQGEEYLTDVVGILRSRGDLVAAFIAADVDDVHGINDRVQLAAAERIMADRINEAWMRAGVTIQDPHTVWISTDAVLEPDARIERNSQILGTSTIGAGATVGPDTTLVNCAVGADATVVRSQAEQATIGRGATVGPFTYLRPGTELGDGAKAGAYVEIKNSTVGEDSKVPHLSYVGDADIGPGTNIGAATVFVNYDGVNKHRTVVGANVRVGSDSMLVAPVNIGDGAYTGAGSVITDDVPPGALALGRARQRNIDGWVADHRPQSGAAAQDQGATGDDSPQVTGR